MRKIFVTTIFVIFMAVMSQTILALSFDEFAKTYDYNYLSDDVNITNISFKCRTACDNLTLMIAADIAPGVYELDFSIDEKTYSLNKYFFGGKENVEAVFYPEFKDGNASLSIAIKKEEFLVYQRLNQQFDLSNITFKKNELSVLNESSINETLYIVSNIKVFSPKTYSLSAYLSDGKDYFVYGFEEYISNEENITFIFSPDRDSNFTLVKVLIDNYTIYTDYKTLHYNLSKTKIINDSIEDGRLKITLLNKKNETITLNLYSTDAEFISNTSTKNDSAYFDLASINASGIFGQYVVVYSTNTSSKSYLTGYYSSEDVINRLVQYNNQSGENNSTLITIINETYSEINTVAKETFPIAKKSIGGFGGGFMKKEETVKINTSNNNNESAFNDSIVTVESEKNSVAEKNSEIIKDKQISKSNSNKITGNSVFETREYGFPNKNILAYSVIILSVILCTAYFIHRRKMSEVVIIK